MSAIHTIEDITSAKIGNKSQQKSYSHEEAFTRAALYTRCTNHPLLQQLDLDNMETETIRKFLNRCTAVTIQELPILLSKLIVRFGFIFISDKIPVLKKFINPENIKLRIENDERNYLSNMNTNYSPNIYMIVSKNIILSLIGNSLTDFCEQLNNINEEIDENTTTRSKRKITNNSSEEPTKKIKVSEERCNESQTSTTNDSVKMSLGKFNKTATYTNILTSDSQLPNTSSNQNKEILSDEDDYNIILRDSLEENVKENINHNDSYDSDSSFENSIIEIYSEKDNRDTSDDADNNISKNKTSKIDDASDNEQLISNIDIEHNNKSDKNDQNLEETNANDKNVVNTIDKRLLLTPSKLISESHNNDAEFSDSEIHKENYKSIQPDEVLQLISTTDSELISNTTSVIELNTNNNNNNNDLNEKGNILNNNTNINSNINTTLIDDRDDYNDNYIEYKNNKRPRPPSVTSESSIEFINTKENYNSFKKNHKKYFKTKENNTQQTVIKSDLKNSKKKKYFNDKTDNQKFNNNLSHYETNVSTKVYDDSDDYF